jgi:hypothetical protein
MLGPQWRPSGHKGLPRASTLLQPSVGNCGSWYNPGFLALRCALAPALAQRKQTFRNTSYVCFGKFIVSCSSNPIPGPLRGTDRALDHVLLPIRQGLPLLFRLLHPGGGRPLPHFGRRWPLQTLIRKTSGKRNNRRTRHSGSHGRIRIHSAHHRIAR